MTFVTGVSWLAICGLISAALSTLAFLPYIRDTLARKTHPQRASWLVWSVLGSISFMSQIYEGAVQSLLFASAQVGGTILVFVLSLWLGVGGLLNRRDASVLAIAAVGLGLWFFTENAVYALGISIGISLLGGTLTVRKAYLAPWTETLSTWSFSFIAAAFALLAVGQFDPVLAAYPAYLFVLSGATSFAILAGRNRQGGMAPAA